jgi:hypothetical protein
VISKVVILKTITNILICSELYLERFFYSWLEEKDWRCPDSEKAMLQVKVKP